MEVFDQRRRGLLLGMGALGLGEAFSRALLGDGTDAQRGFVLGPTGGEHLIHFRDGGNIFIQVGAATGSNDLAIGTQQVMTGTGIPVHRHPKKDEAFHVLEGSGTFLLDDDRLPFEKGGTIFIPRNHWHGFENPDHELLLLWVMTPAGLDGFFHETCSPPGAPPKKLTPEEIREIARKYGTEFR